MKRFVTAPPDNPNLRLINVHPMDNCVPNPCTIHNPTDHHMRLWPLTWRPDTHQFERHCTHGIGHPDPDELTYWTTTNQHHRAVHGCDNCCLTQPV